jgi:predicted RNase H-like HicB family nuclease
MLEINVVFNLKGAFREDKIADGIVSYCPALNVYSHGKTREEAKEALRNAICLFLETCFQRGTLGDILRKAGFNAQPRQAGVAIAAIKQDEKIEIHDATKFQAKFEECFDFEVPLNLVAAQQMSGGNLQHV